MKRAATALFVGLTVTLAGGATIWVDPSASKGVEGASSDPKYGAIQAAINAASNGDEVIVSPGTYPEAITFVGSGLTADFTLRSTDPQDPSVVAATVINATGWNTSVVTFSGSETSSVKLSGFTITGGYADNGGGIDGRATQAAITYCRIVNNRTPVWLDDGPLQYGGGLYRCNGLISHNTISDNVTYTGGGGLHLCYGRIEYNTISGNMVHDGSGGGLSDCPGTIYGNVIDDNWAYGSGAGLSYCGPTECNVITNNYAVCGGGGGIMRPLGPMRSNYICGNDGGRDGGGIDGYGASRVIENCLIADNVTCHSGGGIANCSGAIRNCTIVGNETYRYEGSGIANCNGAIRNCIVWGNDETEGAQIAGSSTPSYSCLENWTGSGVGNTTADPLFADAGAGDYHLLAGSPCIDAADGDVAPEADVDGAARCDDPGTPNTGIGTPPYADMGAYEYWAPSSGDLPAGWCLMSFPLEPVDPECSAALDDCVAAGNDIINNLFRYTAVAAYERYPRPFTQVELGVGYWLYLDVAATEWVSGTKSPDPVVIALTGSWTMIGTPDPQPVLWSACSVSDGAETKTVPQAVAEGWIDATAYYYDAGSYKSLRCDGSGDDDSLRPWHGYWLLANQAGLSLIVPAP